MNIKERMTKRGQRGLSLLEYAAGAAIIAGVVWAAMDLLGQSMKDFFTQLAAWFASRTVSGS